MSVLPPTVVVIRHTFSGHRDWVIEVYSTGKRWNAKVSRAGGVESDFAYGDPFGARSEARSLKKALRHVKECDERYALSDALDCARKAAA